MASDGFGRYNLRWRAQRLALTALYHLICRGADALGISALNHVDYAERFRTFMMYEVLGLPRPGSSGMRQREASAAGAAAAEGRSAAAAAGTASAAAGTASAGRSSVGPAQVSQTKAKPKPKPTQTNPHQTKPNQRQNPTKPNQTKPTELICWPRAGGPVAAAGVGHRG